MQILRQSSVEEYSRHFWERQRKRATDRDRKALVVIDTGGDPVAWLRKLYPYKLPRADSDVIVIANLDFRPIQYTGGHRR